MNYMDADPAGQYLHIPYTVKIIIDVSVHIAISATWGKKMRLNSPL